LITTSYNHNHALRHGLVNAIIKRLVERASQTHAENGIGPIGRVTVDPIDSGKNGRSSTVSSVVEYFNSDKINIFGNTKCRASDNTSTMRSMAYRIICGIITKHVVSKRCSTFKVRVSDVDTGVKNVNGTTTSSIVRIEVVVWTSITR